MKKLNNQNNYDADIQKQLNQLKQFNQLTIVENNLVRVRQQNLSFIETDKKKIDKIDKKLSKLEDAEHNKKAAKLKASKQKQQEYIETEQGIIQDIDMNLVAILEDKQNLIKQLSERKAAEKLAQAGASERVENQTNTTQADDNNESENNANNEKDIHLNI